MCKIVSQSRFKFLIPIGIVICIAIYHPEKRIQYSLGFWIPPRGFPIPGTGFQSFSVELGFWILIFIGILDSKVQYFGFNLQNFLGFRIPQANICQIPELGFPTWGNIWCS